jgi:EmrB/QacA subfamily drug resistance transporter
VSGARSLLTRDKPAVFDIRLKSNARVTFLVLALAGTGYALLQSLVIPVLPTIQAALHTSEANVTWVLTAYLLAASVFTPIAGRFGDMWGKRKVFLFCIIAFAAGCGISAVAGSLAVMIVGRVVQGIGGGLIPLAFGIIRDEMAPEKVAGAVGLIAALTAVGVGLGLVLAGPIVDNLSWRWLFWSPMALLLVTTVVAFIVLPESPERVAGRVNWLAAGLLCAWLVALLLPVSEAPVWGWGSTRVIGLLITSAILAAAWVTVERRAAQPLIDLRMMRIPVVWTAGLVALLLGVGMYAVFAFLPQMLQTPKSTGYGFGASITESGLLLLPNCAGSFIMGALCGRLTLRHGGRKLLLVGNAVGVVAFLMLVFARSQEWEIAVAETLMGAGFGLAFAAMSNLIVQGVPLSQTGVASGTNTNIRTIGGSIGAAIMTSIVAGSAHGGQYPTNAGYTHGFVFLTVAALGATVATLFVPKVLRPQPGPGKATQAIPEPGMVRLSEGEAAASGVVAPDRSIKPVDAPVGDG